MNEKLYSVAVNRVSNQRVPVVFYVSKKGKVCHVNVPSSVPKERRRVIKRVFLSSPLWIPAIYDGSAIRDRFVLPVYLDIMDIVSDE